MSSTNRGAERREADHYPTPEGVTRDLIRRCAALREQPIGSRWCEPACGEGAIVRGVEAERPGAQRWSLVELRAGVASATCTALLASGPRVELAVEGDALRLAPAGLDVYVTNPPYVHAEAFVRRLRALAGDRGVVALLLRLGFFGSLERMALWRDVGVPDAYVVVPRPPFSVDKHGRLGTDSCEYAWFVWAPGVTGRVHPPDRPWREGRARRGS